MTPLEEAEVELGLLRLTPSPSTYLGTPLSWGRGLSRGDQGVRSAGRVKRGRGGGDL